MDIERNVKNKSETADIERIGFLHSLKAKILLLVAAAVVLTVVLNLWTVIPKSSSNISELTYMYLSAGFEDERGDYPVHHPKALFNEDVCPIGAACYAQCAETFLKNRGKI